MPSVDIPMFIGVIPFCYHSINKDLAILWSKNTPALQFPPPASENFATAQSFPAI